MLGGVLQTIIVIVLFYIVGALTYRTKEQKKFKFLKVLVTFIGTLISNAILLSVLIVLSSAVTLLISTYFFDVNELMNQDIPIFTGQEKFETGNTLLAILIFILLTAVTQFKIRKFFLRKIPFLQMELDEYEICEYFIQWMTIYLVIYQFLFDGLKEITKFVSDVSTADNVFAVMLSPENMNLVIQPLLIASWIVMVMEKINLREKLELEAKLAAENNN